MGILKFSCSIAKQKSIVGYLGTLGHKPKKVRGTNHWYLSPLREENTPSFKVDDHFNIWYDHGTGQGGNLVDFGILYHQCSVKALLEKWAIDPFFQQPLIPSSTLETGRADRLADSTKIILPGGLEKTTGAAGIAGQSSPIKLLGEGEIHSGSLLHYLEARRIPLSMAEKYCREVDFELYGKKITALGFPNRSGGYELRNAGFKGSNSPKDISFIDNGKDQISVFEGFFSFLSFLAATKQDQVPLTNFLILNSLAYLEKSRSLMEHHGQIDLLLDLDPAGIRDTKKALGWHPKYKDRSELFAGHKDLNDWLVAKNNTQSQGHRKGRHR